MIENINDEELKTWSLGGDINKNKPYFIIIKTPTCPKCALLLKDFDNIFGDLKDTVYLYEFDFRKASPAATKIFTSLNLVSAPSLIYRYFDENVCKLATIPIDVEDEFINLKNVMDALNENDQKYFGFNEYDEAIENDAEKSYNRLLHLIYGELAEEVKKEHNLFKKELNN